MKLNEKIPLNLGNCKAFMPKNINIAEKPRLNKNINVIEQMNNMSKDNSQAGTIKYPSKEELSKSFNVSNNFNNQNYFKQNEIIFKNEDKMKISPIYNFYQTTEEYLRETNNTYIDFEKSKNYLHKNNPLKSKEQSPNMNLTENNDNKYKELNNFTIPANNTCYNYSKDNYNFNLNNLTSQKYNNIVVNPVNSKQK